MEDFGALLLLNYFMRQAKLLFFLSVIALSGTDPAMGAVKFKGIAGSYAASSGHLGAGAVTLSSWTIEMWVKPESLNQAGLLDIHGDWKQTTINIRSAGGVGAITFRPNTGYNTISGSGVITLGEWQLLTFVSDGQNLKIYRNGIQVVSGDVSPEFFVRGEIAGSVTGTFNFGMEDYQTLPDANFYNGAIADFRVWNRALSSVEISRHVTQHPKLSASGLLNWIPFNETSGNTFTDIVNGVTGSYHNVDFVPGPSLGAWLEVKVSKVMVTQHVTAGESYILESSLDLVTWSQVGAQFTAQNNTILQEFDVAETGRFFRIRQLP
jgi:hypothetical protein